jgi:hypothetical protein
MIANTASVVKKIFILSSVIALSTGHRDTVAYENYVSVEVFIFDPGPEAIATKSLKYMQQFA